MRLLRLALILMVGSTAPLLAQHYADQNAWRFVNFSDDTYSWEIYRDTFIGIPPTNDAWASAFDVLFYEQVYKDKLSPNGNCYGMSLMSLMMLKKGAHFGYCLPIPLYSGDLSSDEAGPSDPILRRAINVMHGHQINLPTLQWILDIIAVNKNRDGNFAFQTFRQTRLKKDLALISITKTLNPADGGHTMVAYDAQDLGGGNKRILVYDPSRPYPTFQAWYDAGDNFVQINGSAWSFTKADGSTGSGSPSSGGNIIITPASVTGPHSRSPASLGDQIIGRVLNELLLTGENASVEQITDGRGRRLYRPGTFEVDNDPSTGMLNMVPFIPSDQVREGQHAAAYFQLGPAGGSLTIRVRSGDSGYALWAAGSQSQVMVRSRGGRGVDTLRVQAPGGREPSLLLENGRGAEYFEVQFVQAIKERERLHVLRASRLSIPQGAVVELALADGGQALRIANEERSLRYDLEFRSVTAQGVASLQRIGIEQAARSLLTVRPRRWSDLKSRDVLEQLLPNPRSADSARNRAER
jgi:hypothetical protein